MKSTIPLLLSGLLLAACNSTTAPPPLPDWIGGRWVMRPDSSITIIEDWKKLDDNSWQGEVYEFKDGDSARTEVLTIRYVGDSIILLADVAHNPAPVSFVMSKSGEQSIEFVNPLHDFPKSISYRIDSLGKLRARVGADTNFIDFEYSLHQR